MYTMNQIIKLLEDIGHRGKLCEGGEQYPNAECCYDAANTLRNFRDKTGLDGEKFIHGKV